MGSADDIAYKKSVRNTSVVLAAIVITIVATLFVPPLLNPAHNVYQSSVSSDSPYGFVVHLTISTTSLSTQGTISLTGWVNSTSPSIANITASNAWALQQSGLWGRICTAGWPIGLGVMQGHYTQDNYTQGKLLPIRTPAVLCPVMLGTPKWFAFEPSPHSSTALIFIQGTPHFWLVQTSFDFGPNESGVASLQPGVYTAVIADEWGDVLTTNFVVS